MTDGIYSNHPYPGAAATFPAVGEANTALNVGTGTGLYYQKAGVVLQFKRIGSAAGTITVTDNAGSGVNFEVNQNDLTAFVGATGSVDGAQGVVPQPLIADRFYYLRGDGVWHTVIGANVMTGASISVDGVAGAVPQPLAANYHQFLRGDGTWAAPTGTVSSVGVSSSTLTLSGTNPVTSTGTIGVNLTTTISAAGPIGSASVIPVITYDAYGRLTTVTTAAVTASAVGALPASGGTTGYLTTWSSSSALTASQYLAAGNFPALTGDVTTSVGSLATTIAASAVSLANMANLAANSVIGNNTGSPATPVALTQTQLTAMVNNFSNGSGHAAGTVPDPGNTTTSRVLGEQGAWVGVDNDQFILANQVFS